jgi:hypothetical protein
MEAVKGLKKGTSVSDMKKPFAFLMHNVSSRDRIIKEKNCSK